MKGIEYVIDSCFLKFFESRILVFVWVIFLCFGISMYSVMYIDLLCKWVICDIL